MESIEIPFTLPFCYINQILKVDNLIQILGSVKRSQVKCPTCDIFTTKIHGYYWRKLMDLPISQFRVDLHLKVCRYRCQNKSCSRKTFTHQVENLFERYQRATSRLTTTLFHIAQAVGGLPGSRLAFKLGIPRSGSTLLRIIRKAPDPLPSPIRVLGIDDWAIRKGQTYGTILVNLERRQVVDLLSSRTPSDVSCWLKAHQTIQFVSRDRSAEYKQGIDLGAPQATQIADRWHLHKNLSGITEKALIEAYLKLKKQIKNSNSLQDHSLREKFPRGKPDELRIESNRQDRMKQYELIKFLKAKGLSTRRIAKILSISRGLATKYVDADQFPERNSTATKPSKLDPYIPYLKKRTQTENLSSKKLWQEIKDLGYPLGPSQVRKWIRGRQVQSKLAIQSLAHPISSNFYALPKRRELMRLISMQKDKMELSETHILNRVILIPEIGLIYRLHTQFSKILRDGEAKQVESWLNDCDTSDIPAFERFATSIKKDLSAVKSAIESPWSNGQTEGQVNRLKMIKRQMYGRAKIDLLRKRLIYKP